MQDLWFLNSFKQHDQWLLYKNSNPSVIEGGCHFLGEVEFYLLDYSAPRLETLRGHTLKFGYFYLSHTESLISSSFLLKKNIVLI